MSKNLIKVNTESEVIEAQKNLEEPFVILVKDGNKLIYQDDSHCDVVMLIDDWNNYHTEIPVILRDISWIKGRRCLVKKIDDGVAICYLDENNSELFHDGVTPAKLDGTMGLWMTDLPEFNILCIEGESDWVKIYISKDLEIGHKSRRVLLGVTKSYIQNGVMNSIKIETHPTGNTNISLHHYCANAVGDGFDIIDYETHCKLAYMYLAKYKNKDASLIFATSSNQSNLGYTSNKGNNDYVGLYPSIFGAEQVFDGHGEYMGGINALNDLNGLVYYIYDGLEMGKVPDTPHRTTDPSFRTSQLPSGGLILVTITNTDGYISRMLFGEYADLIPKEASGCSKYFYPDTTCYGSFGWKQVARMYYLNSSPEPKGIFNFYANLTPLETASTLTSRLQYRGNITVIDDPLEFIALPVGF